MPVPQVPEALSQGVIDGAVVPWEVVPAIRLQEMVRNHTEIPGTPDALYRHLHPGDEQARSYDGLPADLKRVLDANSGAGRRRDGRQGRGTSTGPVVEADGAPPRQRDH